MFSFFESIIFHQNIPMVIEHEAFHKGLFQKKIYQIHNYICFILRIIKACITANQY